MQPRTLRAPRPAAASASSAADGDGLAAGDEDAGQVGTVPRSGRSAARPLGRPREQVVARPKPSPHRGPCGHPTTGSPRRPTRPWRSGRAGRDAGTTCAARRPIPVSGALLGGEIPGQRGAAAHAGRDVASTAVTHDPHRLTPDAPPTSPRTARRAARRRARAAVGARTSSATTCWPRCAPASDPFPGIVGFDDTVLPELERALLAGHDLVLLGERGQGKTRLIRTLVGLLDEWTPVIAGCELHEHPYAPVPVRAGAPVAEHGDDAAGRLAAPQRALRREARHAGHQRRRPDRRRRPDQGRRGPHARRPGDDPLRPGAAHQPRHLRHQRAARPGRADPGVAAQRAGGARHPGPRLRAAAAARPAAGRAAPTPRTTPTAAASSPRSRTASARRSAPTTRCGSPTRSTWCGRRRTCVALVPAPPARGRRALHPRGARVAGGRPAFRRLRPLRRRRRRDRWPASALRRAAITGEAAAVARVGDLPRVVPTLRGKVEFEVSEEGREDDVLAAPAAARRRRDVPRPPRRRRPLAR